jgi:hypothetical protein
MTTDIVDLNNFIVLIEQSHTAEPIVQECTIETDVVGFAFYGSGSIELRIKHNDQTKYMTNTTGLAISFFSNQKVAFSHTIAPHKPLQSISVFTRVKNLHTLSQPEKDIFQERLPQLMNPKENFVTGPHYEPGNAAGCSKCVYQPIHRQYTVYVPKEQGNGADSAFLCPIG